MRISDLLIKDRINLDVQANDKPSLTSLALLENLQNCMKKQVC